MSWHFKESDANDQHLSVDADGVLLRVTIPLELHK